MKLLFICIGLIYMTMFIVLDNQKRYLCIYLISLIYILDSLGISTEILSVDIAGVNVLATDIILVFLILKNFVCFFERKKITFIKYIIALNLLFVVISTIRGMSSFTIGSLYQELRPFLYFYMAFQYFLEEDNKDLEKVESILIKSGIIISIIVLIKIVLVLLGFNIAYHIQKFRVINANVAFFIASTAIISLKKIEDKRMGIYILLQYLAAIVVMHRTVWICLIGATAIVSLSNRKVFKSVIVGVVLVSILSIPFFALTSKGNEIYTYFVDSVEEVNTKGNTFDWRKNSWKALLNKDYIQSTKDFLFGKPFGYGYKRKIQLKSGQYGIVNQSPHNNYVVLILRVGIFGTIVFIVLYLYVLFHIKRDVKNKEEQFIMFAMVVMQLLYYIPYTFNLQHGLFLGIIAGMLKLGDENINKMERRLYGYSSNNDLLQ